MQMCAIIASPGFSRPSGTLDFPLAHSLMLGAACNYMRLIANGAKPTRNAPELLAQAGWDAVRQPQRPRARKV
jgi:hypothetical protein